MKKIMIAFLALPLLAGCVDDGHRLTAADPDPVPLTPYVPDPTTTTSTTSPTFEPPLHVDADMIEMPQPAVVVIDAPATASAPAERTNPPTSVATAEPPVPQRNTVGLHGKPFAPEGLTDCQDMEFYRVQWGLPERFIYLGKRESSCINAENVKTYCCYGRYQLYFSMHMKDARMQPVYADCEVRTIYDYNGDEPLDKQKQACVAKGLYDVAGLVPWKI